jgi:hypothetical protein
MERLYPSVFLTDCFLGIKKNDTLSSAGGFPCVYLVRYMIAHLKCNVQFSCTVFTITNTPNHPTPLVLLSTD